MSRITYYPEIPCLTLLAIMLNVFEAAPSPAQCYDMSQHTNSTNIQLT